MSMRREVEVICPRCGRKHNMWAWLLVNVADSPGLKEELLAGRLNRFQCECGFEEFLAAHLRYVDDEKQFRVQLMPFEDIEDVLGQLIEDGEFRMDSKLRNQLPKHIKDIRLVFAMDELARHVVLRDTLAAWHAQSKAKPFVCFACGGPIRSGDSYYCISRLHQVKGNSDESQDDIVNAMATIQVCEGCKTKAVTRDIVFPFLPIWQKRLRAAKMQPR